MPEQRAAVHTSLFAAEFVGYVTHSANGLTCHGDMRLTHRGDGTYDAEFQGQYPQLELSPSQSLELIVCGLVGPQTVLYEEKPFTLNDDDLEKVKTGRMGALWGMMINRLMIDQPTSRHSALELPGPVSLTARNARLLGLSLTQPSHSR